MKCLSIYFLAVDTALFQKVVIVIKHNDIELPFTFFAQHSICPEESQPEQLLTFLQQQQSDENKRHPLPNNMAGPEKS